MSNKQPPAQSSLTESDSLRAKVADHLGEDPGDGPWNDPHVPRTYTRSPPRRLSIAQALRVCPRMELRAAIDRDESQVVVAVLSDGTQLVLSDTCPHDGGLLSDGYIDGAPGEEVLVCSRHNWEFDARSGQCQHRPDIRLSISAHSESLSEMTAQSPDEP